MKTKLLIYCIIVLLSSCSNNVEEIIIPYKELSDSEKDIFNIVFSSNNVKLNNEQTIIYKISSNNELRSIIPDNTELPVIDFSQYCIIYTYITTPSISDKLIDNKLYYNKKEGYRFDVYISKCAECYYGIGQFYPYGIYRVLSPELLEANVNVKYLESIK
ncbi:MAG: hypothetical protein IJ650_06710 [Paludibacteraceae bacterium]|nr:hypothetical protein [Paludibacteraceae bacterium]